MSRKGIPLLFLVSLLCLFVFSCADRDAAPTKDSVGPVADESERLEEEIGRSSELRELIAIRDELAARAIARNVTPEQIRETAGDVDGSNALLGLTPDEARARFDRIDALVDALFERYPALADIAVREEAHLPVCDADGIALAWEHYSKVLPAAFGQGAALVQGAPARPPLTCKTTQLVVGFALCALKSGGAASLYFVCSYGVFCSACDGGLADIICP
ncbi:MAG: hypothetical protein WC674_02885 [Candidatus Krumholzibacteriia bacterium]